MVQEGLAAALTLGRLLVMGPPVPEGTGCSSRQGCGDSQPTLIRVSRVPTPCQWASKECSQRPREEAGETLLWVGRFLLFFKLTFFSLF